MTEIRTLCEAPCYEGLVEFHGAFYTPDSGQISIALEYMDGGSLADILKLRKRIPEPVLSSMFQKLLRVCKISLNTFNSYFYQAQYFASLNRRFVFRVVGIELLARG